MAAVIAFDRRAAHFVASKPEWLDRTNDLDALAAETYGLLEKAHEAHWTNEPTLFLRAITRAGEKVVRIGKIAREASGAIEAAPAIHHDQLALWVRPDGAGGQRRKRRRITQGRSHRRTRRAGTASTGGSIAMGLLQRIEQGPAERLPDRIVPMWEREERRSKARWIERKEAVGLPVQDSTWRVTREAA